MVDHFSAVTAGMIVQRDMATHGLRCATAQDRPSETRLVGGAAARS